MKETMLIVEDEKDINYALSSNFKKQGYHVLTAGTAEAGLKMAAQHDPDIVLLDIMLPKMDGLEMMRLLRQKSQAPVLFLSAKKDEIDRILGFKLGADDYITKPFSLQELSLRVKAVLRHTGPAQKADEKPIRLGTLEIDFERHAVLVKGREVSLPPREFQLLKLLVEARGKVLTREQLAKCIWGDDDSMEIDIRTVDQHIARLRKKLLSEKSRIVTVNNFGYQIKMDENPVSKSRQSKRK